MSEQVDHLTKKFTHCRRADGDRFLPCFKSAVLGVCRVPFMNAKEHSVSSLIPQVTLTLMGDESSIPWRLLSIEFLVQDLETGGILVYSNFAF